MVRNTRQRAAILAVVQSTDCHPTAEWVFQEVRKSLPSVSLSTVYRNLDGLVRDGMLTAIPGESRSTRYDGNLHAHAHLVCAACGRIMDAAPPGDAGWIQAMARDAAFSVSEIRLELRGICASCARAASSTGF